MWSWGKTDRDGLSTEVGGPAWNPLVAHLLDTGAVALELWDRYLPDPARDRLTDGFGAGDRRLARDTVAFLAALHDLGKCSPAFTGRFGSGRGATDRMRRERGLWEDQARAAGLPLPTTWTGIHNARHEHLTTLTLPTLLGCRCPGTGDGTECLAQEHRGLYVAAACLGGHHGHLPKPASIKRAYGAAGGTAWDAVRLALVDVVADRLGVDLAALPSLVRQLPSARPSTLVLFAGLVVLSDWIASDTRRFPYARPTDDPSELWQRSGRRATEAVTALGLDRWRPGPADWGRLWPGTTPRRFQADAMRLLPERGQALVIVESDTGSGKTRLALWCAHQLAARNGYQGVYLAMPTRAATHQAAAEVEGFLPGAVEADTVNMALVHGAAGATDLVHRLVDAARAPAPGTEEGSGAADDLAGSVQHVLDAHACDGPDDGHDGPSYGHHTTSTRVVLDPWYLRRCLGLVATFGIGTVDQVVLAAQPSRHWFLRTFGLACKIVVIDEAHAYELYQQQLLGAAVEWLADAGASVIVLSATLPAAVRTALTEAWGTGLRVALDDPGEPGPITVVDGAGRVRRGGPAPDEVESLRTTVILEADPGPQELAAQLLEQARDGGCVGVVRTRVDTAVALHEEARAQAKRYGWDPEDVVLLHGRMLPRDRQPLEERLTAMLGPATDPELRRAGMPNPDRPGRLLVIATQVIEQSLDLDFDHLVSDLAPIDLLIQRRGRQHRHRANDPGRPAWCGEVTQGSGYSAARMVVLYRPDPLLDGLPLVEPAGHSAMGNADGLVYAPYTLAATYRTLITRQADGHSGFATPMDSAELVESVYGPRQEADGAWGELLARTWDAWQDALQQEGGESAQRALHPYRGARRVPAEVWDLASGRDNGAGDEGGTPQFRALSRLGDPSVGVVCLYQHGDRLTYDVEGTLPVETGARPGTSARRRQDRGLLLNTLAFPAHWFDGARPLPAAHTWPTPPGHPPLDRSHVALFDAAGRCVTGPAGRVRYDPVTGLSRT
ncbi:CRISPR-associated helicase Cas3' [Streptomyces sp. Isolate_45]|uniref:CRISPR-associated helicase Cas3' n=1 Tax=Streptomyces sp. Isolate_45 TaxID=2950111 RepID=UPI002481C6BA|nr:CRISPR-associated helicase Cas3' [Streptomyces sp. Isolate_45]MDA5285529.1 CRISPR-associated helicase Cas3' [Streptomyces sp. Isolate_45]